MINYFKTYAPLVFIICLTLFFSTYKLTESPRTWMDEGIITQVSRNIAEHGKHALQVAPGTFVSAGVVSTGYPVTFPISIFFDMFGVSLLSARMIMVIFILILVLSVYCYLKNQFGNQVAFFGTTLIATFSPLYGHGKNVLGEIPGLALLMLLLICVDKMMNSKEINFWNYILLGTLAGLVFSTKPIFILLIPALSLIYSVFIFSKKIQWSKYHLLPMVSFFVVFVCWFLVQFEGDSLSFILSVYSNPHSTLFLDAVASNLVLLFTEFQPLYFVGTFFVWAVSLLWRFRNNTEIKSSELIAFVFSSLILVAFLRTTGYYRYFFLAQFLSLVYFLPSISFILNNKFSKIIKYVVLLMIIFHLYQTNFNSWVASYYKGNRSAQISENVKDLKLGEKVLLYQTPEFVVFLKDSNYYQYMDITQTIKVGESNIQLIQNNFFDRIFINSSLYGDQNTLFSGYKKEKEFDSYIILKKTQ